MGSPLTDMLLALGTGSLGGVSLIWQGWSDCHFFSFSNPVYTSDTRLEALTYLKKSKYFVQKKGSFYPALYTSTLSVVFTGNRFLFSSIQICQRVYTGNSISIKEVIWFGQGFLIYFSLHPMFHVWWTRSVSSSYLSISKSVHFLVLFSPVLRWSRWSKVVFFPVVPQYTGMATEEWVCGKEALTLTKTLSFISYTSILRDFFPPL